MKKTHKENLIAMNEFSDDINEFIDLLDYKMRKLTIKQKYEHMEYMINSAILNKFFKIYGGQSRMSNELGINRGTLRKKLLDYGIKHKCNAQASTIEEV